MICDEASLLRKQEYLAYPYLEIGSEILEEEGLLTETLTVMNRELSSYDAKAVAYITTYVNGVAEYIFFGDPAAAPECLSENGFREGYPRSVCVLYLYMIFLGKVIKGCSGHYAG